MKIALGCSLAAISRSLQSATRRIEEGRQRPPQTAPGIMARAACA